MDIADLANALKELNMKPDEVKMRKECIQKICDKLGIGHRGQTVMEKRSLKL